MMLMILAVCVQEALHALPETEENEYGRSLMAAGMAMALEKKTSPFFSLDDILQQMCKNGKIRQPLS